MHDEEAAARYVALCQSQGLHPNPAACAQLRDRAAHLDGGRTYLGPRGAVCLAAALATAPSVQSLSLRGNQLGNDELPAIARAIVAAPAVRSVDLSGNPAISAGAGKTLLALVRAGRLDELKLDDTNVPLAVRARLARELRLRAASAAARPADGTGSNGDVPPSPLAVQDTSRLCAEDGVDGELDGGNANTTSLRTALEMVAHGVGVSDPAPLLSPSTLSGLLLLLEAAEMWGNV